MKILFSVFCCLMIFFSSPMILNSSQPLIRILIFSSNTMYGHAKFDVITGLKTKISYKVTENLVIKTINFDSNIIDCSMIEREILLFAPSLILNFDNAKIPTKYKYYNVKLYNIKDIVNNIKRLFKNSHIKPNKIMVFYDDYTDISKEEFEIIKTLDNVEFIHIKTSIALRKIITDTQKTKNIVYITLLRYIYDVDSSSYITEPLICKEFQIFNYNHLEIAFKQHTHKYGIAISIGQNNVKNGENIANRYFKWKEEPILTETFINKNRLYRLGFGNILYDNYQDINGIYEK